MSNSYDTRIREMIARTGNPDLFPEHSIPRSTRMTWVRRGPRGVVGLDATFDDRARLVDRIARLENRVRVLTAVLRLVLTMLRLSEYHVEVQRIPDESVKERGQIPLRGLGLQSGRIRG